MSFEVNFQNKLLILILLKCCFSIYFFSTFNATKRSESERKQAQSPAARTIYRDTKTEEDAIECEDTVETRYLPTPF